MKQAQRLSGFMLWDASYAEFKFRQDYWPDYSAEMFDKDIAEYGDRLRRFGK
jgi:undecaprenyl diphosphate synthase